MVTIRYSDQQGSKSRQNPCQVKPTAENIGNLSYTEFSSSRRVTRGQVLGHLARNGTDQCQSSSSNPLTPHREQPRLIRIVVPPTHAQSSQQQNGQITLRSGLINKPTFLGATNNTEIRKNRIPMPMGVEALSW